MSWSRLIMINAINDMESFMRRILSQSYTYDRIKCYRTDA
jgi:hypothetical protein